MEDFIPLDNMSSPDIMSDTDILPEPGLDPLSPESQLLMQNIEKTQKMQMMGRKIYKSKLNQQIEERKQMKNFDGLNLAENYQQQRNLKLQKGKYG